MEDVRYPAGRYLPEVPLTDERRTTLIDEIAALPTNLEIVLRVSTTSSGRPAIPPEDGRSDSWSTTSRTAT